ncbi:hypothetical protein ACOSP7_018406 [Xanthoceras sorbifolium]
MHLARSFDGVFFLGRELLIQGCHWRVGNGDLILIYRDCWIPRPSTFRIISPPILSEFALVSRLKLPSRAWNKTLIRSVFLSMDADAILGIPSSSRSIRDSVCWHYDKLGMFSVKNIYWLDCSELTVSSGSGLSSVES